MEPSLRSDQVRSTIPRQITALLILAGTASVAALVVLSIWMTQIVENLTQDNETRLVQSSLAAIRSSQALLTEDYSDWDTAYRWILAEDEDALYDNLGSGIAESGFVAFGFILDQNGTPLFAYEAGVEESDHVIPAPEFTQDYITALRQQPIRPTGVVTGFDTWNGVPVSVAISRFLDDDATEETPDTFPIFLTVEPLTEETLLAMGDALNISGLSILTAAPQEDAYLPLTDLGGVPMGALSWSKNNFGEVLLRQSLWAILFLGLSLVALYLLINRITLRLTRAFLAERMQARYDALTGLLNRSGLDEQIADPDLIRDLRQSHLAAVYMDLDRFKHLNDQHGHGVGDNALQIIANRMRRFSRDADILVRMGGDEFLVLLRSTDPHTAAQLFVDRVLDAGETPTDLGEGVFESIDVSIGTAVARVGQDLESLILRADANMYAQKRARKSMHAQPSMSDVSDVTVVNA